MCEMKWASTETGKSVRFLSHTSSNSLPSIENKGRIQQKKKIVGKNGRTLLDVQMIYKDGAPIQKEKKKEIPRTVNWFPTTNNFLN